MKINVKINFTLKEDIEKYHSFRNLFMIIKYKEKNKFFSIPEFLTKSVVTDWDGDLQKFVSQVEKFLEDKEEIIKVAKSTIMEQMNIETLDNEKKNLKKKLKEMVENNQEIEFDFEIEKK